MPPGLRLLDGEPRDEHDLPAEALELRETLRALEGERLRLVFLDACRDNPLANTIAACSRSMSRGLAYVETLVQSTLITFAAGAGTVADGDGNLEIPHKPVLGVTLDRDRLARYTPDPGPLFA